MKKQELYDQALESILRYAAPIAEEKLFEKMSGELEEPEYSPEHQAATRDMFRAYRRRRYERWRLAHQGIQYGSAVQKRSHSNHL